MPEAASLEAARGPVRMRLIKFLYYFPGDKLADVLGTTDEHERGLLRQLANSILWITLAAAVFMIAVTQH